jgi:hypothetical protein
MIIEKNIIKDVGLSLSKELLEKANLSGRIHIIVVENEIVVKKATEDIQGPEGMIGLGKGVFDKDSVTMVRELREEWKL